jgi:general nucleoside transport system permease protein
VSGAAEAAGAPREAAFRSRIRVAVVPVLALVAAMVLGGLVMILTDPEILPYWAAFFRNPGNALSVSWNAVSDAYIALFDGAFGSTNAISETIVNATPLIFAGLGFALAYRAGLFNIGGEGQILAGATLATYVGFTFDGLPAIVHLPLALLGGIVGGAIWGFIPGFLKARTGAHEVITTIMLNYIAVSGLLYVLKTDTFLRTGRADPISKSVSDAAVLPTFGDLRVNWGIVLALITAYAIWWLLFRSTLGFEFRSVGANPSAASYAGMSVAGAYIAVMMISGALAGLAGTSYVLGVRHYMSPGFLNYGFDAIALAILGRNHPAGVVAAAILFGALRAGGLSMQAATSTPIDIILVIQALIIVFMAAPALVRAIFRIRAERVAQPDSMVKSWGT